MYNNRDCLEKFYLLKCFIVFRMSVMVQFLGTVFLPCWMVVSFWAVSSVYR